MLGIPILTKPAYDVEPSPQVSGTTVRIEMEATLCFGVEK